MAYSAVARKRASSFTDPTDIAGCQLWLDASQITGLNDGDAVATWSDESGNDNDATQSESTYRPLYKTNIVNSKPVVRFDGSNDYLELDSAVSALGAECSAFIVSAFPDTSPSYVTLLGHGVASATDYTQLAYDTSGYLTWRRKSAGAGPQVTGNADLTDGVFRICTAIGNANGSIARLGIDGGTYGSSATTFSITGTLSYIGVSRYNGSLEQYMKGDHAEVIVYDSALSDSDRGNVESYLSTKYNIALS